MTYEEVVKLQKAVTKVFPYDKDFLWEIVIDDCPDGDAIDLYIDHRGNLVSLKQIIDLSEETGIAPSEIFIDSVEHSFEVGGYEHEMVNIHWYDDWIERGEKREKMGFYGKVRENKIDSWY
jgi:hypothetical protein